MILLELKCCSLPVTGIKRQPLCLSESEDEHQKSPVKRKGILPFSKYCFSLSYIV